MRSVTLGVDLQVQILSSGFRFEKHKGSCQDKIVHEYMYNMAIVVMEDPLIVSTDLSVLCQSRKTSVATEQITARC